MQSGNESRGTLQAEIRQTKPFRSPRHEAAVGLLKTADLARRMAGQAIGPKGLSVEQFNVLRILRGARPQGLPTLDIADRMIEQSPAITRLLDKLETKGLVARHRCDKDRRRIYCLITPAGLALLEELEDPVDRSSEALFAGLDPSDLLELIRLMDKVRAGAKAPDHID